MGQDRLSGRGRERSLKPKPSSLTLDVMTRQLLAGQWLACRSPPGCQAAGQGREPWALGGAELLQGNRLHLAPCKLTQSWGPKVGHGGSELLRFWAAKVTEPAPPGWQDRGSERVCHSSPLRADPTCPGPRSRCGCFLGPKLVLSQTSCIGTDPRISRMRHTELCSLEFDQLRPPDGD